MNLEIAYKMTESDFVFCVIKSSLEYYEIPLQLVLNINTVETKIGRYFQKLLFDQKFPYFRNPAMITECYQK